MIKDCVSSIYFRDWISPMAPRELNNFLGELASHLRVGPHSVACADLLLKADHVALLEYSVPHDAELEDYRAAVQIIALLKKAPWAELGIDPLRKGVEAFIKAEVRCSETNLRLGSERPKGPVSVAMWLASRKISSILGEVPPLGMLSLRYGPGANTSVRRAQASVHGKLRAPLGCSGSLLPHAGELLAEMPHLAMANAVSSSVYTSQGDADQGFATFKGRVEVWEQTGRLTFVPKDAKVLRPIVVEPSLNGMAQLGIGAYLKGRILRCTGLDLTDQERNRRLACKGSIDGSLASIDLSSASDTLSLGLVHDLLPADWVEFLSRYRSESVTYGDFSLLLEKFSSMGNGYTFELESLIFWALAWGCCQHLGLPVDDLGVFGDDIIVPTPAVGLLFEVLDWCGFWVNTSKSYWSGPFRESCGADWLAGKDVRPFFIREEVSDRTLYTFHNWLLRRGERKLASVVESWTCDTWRLYGPDGYGDGHLLGSHSLYLPRRERRSGYEGGYFDTYALGPKRVKTRGLQDFLLPTYTVYRRMGEEMPSDPWVTPGSEGYVRRSIYTTKEGIFLS
jgi:hypothetical protein